MLKKLGLFVLALIIILVLGLIFLRIISNQFGYDYIEVRLKTCNNEYTKVFIDSNETGNIEGRVQEQRIRFVRIDFSNFTDKTCLNLFDDMNLESDLKKKEFYTTNLYEWRGMFIDAPKWKACFINSPKENKSFGRIFIGSQYYTITPLDSGLHTITKGRLGIFSKLFGDECNENMLP